jgi:hypothetical protein
MVYEGENSIYLSGEGFFARYDNTVARDVGEVWRVSDDDKILVDGNEGCITFTQKPLLGEYPELVFENGVIELVGVGDEQYLLAETERIPAGSPSYYIDTETENVYEVRRAFGGRDFSKDIFLGEPAFENGVLVRNVATDQARPMELDVFEREFESGRLQNVLHFRKC